MKLRRVIIVGTGLIGSSIGLDLIKRRLAREVIGVGRSRSNLQVALKKRAVHRIFVIKNPNELTKLIDDQTDLVLLATPVSTIRAYLKVLNGTQVLVMDVGSSKTTILREATKQKINFVAAHPIAGTEKSGAKGGELNLFMRRKCLLVLSRETAPRSLALARYFWKSLGSECIELSAEQHDRILGVVSHLPHVVAYSLVRTIARLISVKNETRFALGGLRDTVRIAASPPEMWTEIFLENSRWVLPALRRYIQELKTFSHLVQTRDRHGLQRYLKKAQAIRLQIP